MAYERTDAHREQCRARILAAKPWLKSTGPKTKRGKKRSSKNATKPATVRMYLAAENAGDYPEAARIWRRMYGTKTSYRLIEHFEAAAADDYNECNRIWRRHFGYSLDCDWR